MQLEEVARLPIAMPHLDDALGFIAERCRGRRVLNVGATGAADRFFDGRATRWLHHEIASRAARLVGVDIDVESVALARAHGIANLLIADCTTMQLGETFDVIVLSEVIEHLEAPGAALRNLIGHLAEDGEIIVTTPNPSYGVDAAKTALGGAPAVYYDHVCAFYPENLAVLCKRVGATVVAGHFFSFADDRRGYRWKSRLIRQLGRMAPRLHGSFLQVIRRQTAAA